MGDEKKVKNTAKNTKREIKNAIFISNGTGELKLPRIVIGSVLFCSGLYIDMIISMSAENMAPFVRLGPNKGYVTTPSK